MNDPPPHIYNYRLFDITAVCELYRYKPQLRSTAYISDNWNGELDAIRAAIAEGYRWTRTEGTLAIFERQLPAPAISVQIPHHIAATAATLTNTTH